MQTDVTDESLMRAVHGGDLEALGQLFERHHRQLFHFLSRTTGDASAAEDLTQEVFVRMLRYRHTYDADSRFDTWMFRIARNARADYFRKKAPASIAVDDAFDVADITPDPAEQMERRLGAMRVQRALRQLPDEPRDLIVLARYHDMPYDHIADTLGIEIGAVKVRVHRAMKQLRAIFFRLEGDTCVVKETVKK